MAESALADDRQGARLGLARPVGRERLRSAATAVAALLLLVGSWELAKLFFDIKPYKLPHTYEIAGEFLAPLPGGEMRLAEHLARNALVTWTEAAPWASCWPPGSSTPRSWSVGCCPTPSPPRRCPSWRLPNSLPFMFNAFKLSAGLSMIGAVVAEFFGGPITPLGVYIKNEAGLLRTRTGRKAAWTSS